MIRMGVVESDHIESPARRVPFTPKQIFRTDQESIVLGISLASIRYRLYFGHRLGSVFGKATNEQATTFVRILLLAMFADFVAYFFIEFNHLIHISFAAVTDDRYNHRIAWQRAREPQCSKHVRAGARADE